MSTTPTRKLITSALALSMGIATAASATDTNSLPVLAVVTVTPDTSYTASADHPRLPLMPLVTVTPDTDPVATNHSSTLPRERIADGRLLPRLPTIEVAAAVPTAPARVIAAVAAAEPAAVARNPVLLFGIPNPPSVRFTMPYYSFGNRSVSTSE